MPYLNDFDFLQNGDLVLSEPSVAHNDEYFHRIVLENKPNGRLLLFDMRRKEFFVLVDELYTPNGVQIYEKFLWNQKPNFSTFTSVIFLNTTNGEIIQAWNDPTGNSIGGITQVLPINDKVFLFGTDMAPALFLLKL
uniref:Strictosidine synthase conserved region domain-containing protein n=1 Tax=Panagrolaimus sp. ES5 TaxID=591445 RepID=A0AC34FAC4_9BILA